MTMNGILATVVTSWSECLLNRCAHTRGINSLVGRTHACWVDVLLEESIFYEAHVSSHVYSPKVARSDGLLLETKLVIVF